MTTKTKTATKATKAKATKTTKTKTRIPNLDSDSPTFCLQQVFVDRQGNKSFGVLLDNAMYAHCWRLWCAMGGQRDDQLFIAHTSAPDRELPIPQEFEGDDWWRLAEDWEETVNADFPLLADAFRPPIDTDRKEFYVCKERAILFGPAEYRDCLRVLKSERDRKAVIVWKELMSHVLPAPKSETELTNLLKNWQN